MRKLLATLAIVGLLFGAGCCLDCDDCCDDCRDDCCCCCCDCCDCCY